MFNNRQLGEIIYMRKAHLVISLSLYGIVSWLIFKHNFPMSCLYMLLCCCISSHVNWLFINKESIKAIVGNDKLIIG